MLVVLGTVSAVCVVSALVGGFILRRTSPAVSPWMLPEPRRVTQVVPGPLERHLVLLNDFVGGAVSAPTTVRIECTLGDVHRLVQVRDGGVPVVFSTHRAATLTIDGVPVAIDAAGNARYTLSLHRHLLDLPPTYLLSDAGVAQGTFNFVVSARFPNGPPIEGTVVVHAENYAGEGFRGTFRAVEQGRPLSGVRAPATARNAVLFYPYTERGPQLIGTAAKLGDVPLVAVIRTDDRPTQRTAICGPYGGYRQFRLRQSYLSLWVYATATGQQVMTHRLVTQRDNCPVSVHVRPDQTEVEAHPDAYNANIEARAVLQELVGATQRNSRRSRRRH